MRRLRAFVTAIIVAAAWVTCSTARSQPPERTLGVFDRAANVGQPKNAGSTAFNAQTQEYSITASGENMWANRDEFQFAWKRLKGDFIVQARGRFLTEGGQPHKKFGWIARASLEANAANVDAALHGDGLADFLFRRSAGAQTEEKRFELKGADMVQLARHGNIYTMSVAKFGEPLVSQELSGVELPDELYVGLFVCSHHPDEMCKVLFQNVRITIPAKDNFVPYRDYIGSNIEILDVDTGHRELVYHTPENLEAPNWTPDGKSLILNGRGKLYRFDLAAKTLIPISTGSAARLNNDKVISPDGRWIGLSNNSREDGNKSIVYVMPAEGSEPRRVTPTGHSYLHGWSPDGKFLLFTGQRDGNFDIYRIPAAGGEETRLTRSTGVDDGPEYSPDGQFIFFNSNRTGRMQLWRMKAEGSGEEQLTSEEFNNWFPHVSPDGKRIAFLSFSKEIESADHPYYKHVYLRLASVAGGEPKTIAYVYGGQGTINVPSWSPDSKRLAFISNTAGE